MLKRNDDLIILGISLITCAVLLHFYPESYVEIFGFITGLLCVIYIVRENVWNFPVGILNNLFFIILFYQVSLYADMALQVVYIILALIGSYAWMYGGSGKTRLHVTRISFEESIIVIGVIAVSTILLTIYLTSINDSYPFLDALTTCLSLAAQWLLNFKRLENWIIWMVADIFYIWLYIQKDLNLTAVLYVVFFSLCVIGIHKWYYTWQGDEMLHGR